MPEIVGRVPSALAMFREVSPVPGPSRASKNELLEAFLFPQLKPLEIAEGLPLESRARPGL